MGRAVIEALGVNQLMVIRILITLVVVGIAALFVFVGGDQLWRNGLVSLTALAVSVVVAFKSHIFPFKPNFHLDEIVLAAADSPRQDSPALVVPILVTNEGTGVGMISGFALKVTGNGKTRMYTPVAEVDFGKFISGKRRLHADNTNLTFSPLVIPGEGHSRKVILFTQEPESKAYPFEGWQHGIFVFELFSKSTKSSAAEKVASVTHQVSAEVLGSYAAGQSTSLSSSREIDV